MPESKRVTILETPESLQVWQHGHLKYNLRGKDRLTSVSLMWGVDQGQLLGFLLLQDVVLLDDLIADLREEGRFANIPKSNGTESA